MHATPGYQPKWDPILEDFPGQDPAQEHTARVLHPTTSCCNRIELRPLSEPLWPSDRHALNEPWQRKPRRTRLQRARARITSKDEVVNRVEDVLACKLSIKHSAHLRSSPEQAEGDTS